MDKIVISPKSWHYRFIQKWGGVNGYWTPNDLCSYTRTFLWAFFKITIVISILLIGALCILSTATWWMKCWNQPWNEGSVCTTNLPLWWAIGLGIQAVVAVIVGAMLILGGGIALLDSYGTYMRNRRFKKEEAEQAEFRPLNYTPKVGIVTSMYRAFKHKYCVRVEVKSEPK